MAEDLSSLGEEDVRRLVQVIESLENSNFDFLELEVGGMRVVLGKGNPADYRPADHSSAAAPAAPPAAVAPRPSAPPAPLLVPPTPNQGTPAASPEPQVAAVPEGTVEIRSPIVGLFYAQPEPGAPPFVTVGATVQPDTTVGLVEMMKMFNAVVAGVEGTIVEVLVQDTETVEYGQPLFRVRPN